MACVILIDAKNWQERNRILCWLDNDINYEVITDMKKYITEKYKGRFVAEEEIGGGGNSTQIATTGPVSVENKEVPLLKEMTRNNQMIATEGNASTNVNADVKRENDNEQSVQPEVKNEPVVGAEGPHQNIADNNPQVDTNLAQSTNINNTNTDLNDELPLYAYLSTYPIDESNTDDNGINVQCLENVVEPKEELMGIGNEGTEDGTGSDVAQTEGNVLTKRNTTAPEEDGYGTFVPYRDRMIEPKEENDVAVRAIAGTDIPVISLIEPDQVIANMEESDTVGEQLANDYDINPTEPVPQLMDIAHNEQDLTDVDTDIPLITHSSSNNGNIENDLHTDDGADVPYFENALSDVLPTNNTENSEAPVTVRRSTRRMRRVRNVVEDGDGKEEIQMEKTKSPSLNDRPSTSAVRRSGRITKRPAYSIDDEDGEDECPAVPTKISSSSRKRTSEGRSGDRNGIECRKCMKQLNAQYRRYSHAKEHAIIHTNLIRFECPVNGCGFKCGNIHSFDSHARTKHGRHLSGKKLLCETSEEEEELDQMVKECFLEFETAGSKYKTCEVCQATVSNNSLDQRHLKCHSVLHNDFMLYKCNQSKCKFECKNYKHMIEHGRKKHKIEEMSKEETEIELTDEQKKEIDDMFKKCFFKTDISNTVATGIQCMKCSKQFGAQNRWYSYAKEHAISHTDLIRFECTVDGCGFKCGRRQAIQNHGQRKHCKRLYSAKQIDLTDEQEEELEQMVKECFPEFKKRDGYKVCTVCQVAISNNQHFPKHHSLQHIDFMLYKCNQPKCQHGTKYLEFMTKHLWYKHGIEEIPKKDIEIELTDDQKKEIDEMFKRCFPDEEDVEE